MFCVNFFVTYTMVLLMLTVSLATHFWSESDTPRCVPRGPTISSHTLRCVSRAGCVERQTPVSEPVGV